MTEFIEGARYRLLSGAHYREPEDGDRRGRARVARGEVFTPTEAEFRLNADRLELVETPSGHSTSLSDLTVSELQDLADEHGIDEDDIEGTGSGGQVVKADWIRTLEDARSGG